MDEVVNFLYFVASLGIYFYVILNPKPRPRTEFGRVLDFKIEGRD